MSLTETAAGEAGALLAGEAEYVSFAREPLLARGGLREGTARHLLQQGFSAVTVPELRVSRRAPATTPAFLRDRFRVGRRRGRTRGEGVGVIELGRQAGADARAAWHGRAARPRSERAPEAITAMLIGAGAGATWLGAVRELVGRERKAKRQPPAPR